MKLLEVTHLHHINYSLLPQCVKIASHNNKPSASPVSSHPNDYFFLPILARCSIIENAFSESQGIVRDIPLIFALAYRRMQHAAGCALSPLFFSPLGTMCPSCNMMIHMDTDHCSSTPNPFENKCAQTWPETWHSVRTCYRLRSGTV